MRDLVVDTSFAPNKFKKLDLWPHIKGENVVISHVDEKVKHRFRDIYSRCIECYSCLSACPQSDTWSTQYQGPMWMLQIARLHEHPLDQIDKLRQANEAGIWNCVNCFECANVCPVKLSPASIVNFLRKKIMRKEVKSLIGMR